MDLTVTRQQYDAVRNARHLPDVLKSVLDKASNESVASGRAFNDFSSFK